jgi:hypothetical protein
VVARRRVGNRGGDRDEEYESWSHFEYGADDRALGARNMRAALQGRTEALCAVAEFARGLDVTAIQATVYKLVGRRIERQMDRCLNYSGKLLDRPNMPLRDAGDLPNMAIGALTANLRIPFRLSGLSETAFELSEVDGQVEQSVWYGAYYAHPPAPRALAAELFDGLLLPDLALLVVEYTGSPVPAGVCGICRIPGVLVGSGEEVWCFRCGTLHGEAEEDLPLLVPVAWLRAERPDRCDTCGVSPPFRSAEKWCRCRERRDHERKGVEEGEEELPMDPGFESWTEHGPDALPGAPERAAVEPRQEAPGF